jgi:hypothetical protein
MKSFRTNHKPADLRSVAHPYHHNEGAEVNTTETVASSAGRLQRGVLASLSGLLSFRGAPTPKIARGTGAPAPGLIAALVFALVGVFAFATAPAFAAPPTFTVDPTPTVGYTTAQVSGTVNPENNEVYYWFDYAKDPAVEGWTPGPEVFTRTLASGSGSSPVSETLTGLTPGTGYKVRLHAFAASSGEESFSPEPYVAFTTKPVAKPTVTLAAISTFTSTTADFSGTVDPNAPGATGQDPAFNTPWHFQCTPECPGLTGGEIEGDNTAHEVTAEASGLRPNVDYKVELVASNAGGQTTAGPQTFHTPTIKPTINESTVKSSGETTTTANIEAKVNPGGETTGYVIEYGPSTSYGLTASGSIPAGSAEVLLERELTGLNANEEYHWRLSLTNAAGSATTLDHTFTYSIGGAGLPDGRQYEMVTPPQKNGALVGAAVSLVATQIAENGARVFSTSLQCLPGAESCNLFSGTSVSVPVGFARSASGWVSEPVTPATELPRAALQGANATVGAELFEVSPTANGVRDWYGRTSDNKFFPIGPVAEPNPKGESPAIFHNLATHDLTHLVYSAPRSWAFDQTTPKGQSVYEYEGVGGASPRLVAVAPGSSELVSRCGAVLGGGGNINEQPGTLSEDGETVYFTAEACPAELNDGRRVRANTLYVRHEHARSDLVSGPAPSGEPPAGGEACDAACQSEPQGTASFEGASSDGSRVFFTDPHRLTDRASEDSEETAQNPGQEFEPGCSETPLGLTGCNLYESECSNRCQNSSERRLVDVSAGDTSGEGPRVLGKVAISADGSHMYFAAEGVLTAANSEGHTPLPGQPNLYVYEHDSRFPAGHLAFIATLSASKDEELWHSDDGELANVTPDGRFLVFASYAALTPDDVRSGGPQQIFRYDAETATLTRISIGADGFNDNGTDGILGGRVNSVVTPHAGDAGIVPGYKGRLTRIEPLREDPTMSNDGNFVFFESPVGLTPHALNDVANGISSSGAARYAQNVYEWEAPDVLVNGGVSCTEPAGCVSLISDGKDVGENGQFSKGVELLGSDVSGANVLFATSDQLVAQDTDSERDLYDAHICSPSEPCPPAPQAAPPCLGEVCHGIPAEQLGAPTGGSLTLNGLGNVTPVPAVKKATKKTVKCKKNFVKNKRGKCVRKKSRKKSKAKKSAHINRRVSR